MARRRNLPEPSPDEALDAAWRLRWLLRIGAVVGVPGRPRRDTVQDAEAWLAAAGQRDRADRLLASLTAARARRSRA